MSTTEVVNTVKDIQKETKNLEKAAEKVTRKSSTSATDKEGSSKRKADTHIWAAKDPWSGNTAKDPWSQNPRDKASKNKKPKNSSAKNEKAKKPFNDNVRYQPKLMLEEDHEEKTILIKIGRHTSIRQIIQYALEKIKNDYVVTLNAFQLEMTKALQATEIIKTRLSFLHQLNKLISHSISYDAKEEDDEKALQAPRIRSGISITLSRNQMDLDDLTGYQKPKPRTFLQPPPGQRKQAEEREKHDDLEPNHLKKKRNGKTLNPRPRFSSSEMKEDSKMKPRKSSEEKKAYKPKQSEKVKEKRNISQRSFSDEKYYPIRHHDRYDPYEDYEYFDHYRPQRRPAQKAFESDYDHDKGYVKKESDYDHDKGYVKKERRVYEDKRFHDGYQRRSLEHMRGGGAQKGFRDSHGAHPYLKPRQGPPQDSYKNHGPRGGDSRHKNFEKIERDDRPGYFAGNREFRADKFRNQPLEKAPIGYKNDDFEQERMQKRDQRQYRENRDMRDNRNRPQTQK